MWLELINDGSVNCGEENKIVAERLENSKQSYLYNLNSDFNE